MIEGCLRALLFISGDALLSLIYGKAKNILAKTKETFYSVMRWVFTFLNLWWLMSFLFLDSESSEFPFILSYLIGYPVIIVVWTLIARKKYKSYSLAYSLSNGKNLEENTNESKSSPIAQQNTEKESINNHATTSAKANDYEKEVHTVTEQPPVIIEQQKNSDTLGKDRADCLALKEELKKFPVAKIKQWHADGKITDEQYKAAAKKFNAIKKEIQDIEERIAFIESLESHDVQ